MSVCAERASVSRMKQFQAVVLAGGEGTRLAPLNEELPKCLLPIGTVPMLHYPLALLESSGFEEVIVVFTVSQAEHFHRYFGESYAGGLEIITQAVPDGSGTAEALSAVRPLLKLDVMVISGDLVTDVFLHRFADVHRLNHATVTCLLHEVPAEQPRARRGGGRPAASAAVDDSAASAEVEYMGFPTTETIVTCAHGDAAAGSSVVGGDSPRLLFITTSSDLDEDDMTIPRSALQSRPRMRLTTRFRDAFFYIFAQWTLDLLATNRFHSLKHDLVPLLVRRQFVSRAALVQDGFPEAAFADVLTEAHSASAAAVAHDPEDLVRCYTYICNVGVCTRACTMHAYESLNAMVARGECASHTPWKSVLNMNYVRMLPAGSQVGSEGCFVGEGCKFGEHVRIKKSVIGRFCHIGNNVEIINSILLEAVTVEDGCKIHNCIISGKVRIGKGKTLNRVVGSGVVEDW